MEKSFENLLNKCTTILTASFSDIPGNPFGFCGKEASGLGNFQPVLSQNVYIRGTFSRAIYVG